jgi:signal transduction histidine kinase
VPPLSLNGAVVLVVDDQPANVRLVGTVLTDAGFDVMPATSGEQALARLKHAQPDLILLDMRMPGMDGFEVLQNLRRDAALADIPVIFLTAAAERELVVEALEAGAVDYLTKPFVAEELVARVRAHALLKQYRDRLRKAIEEREHMTSVVAHDLKNPLFNISLSAEMLAEAASEPDKVKTMAGIIAKSAKRAMGFVERYLERRADIELRRGYEPRAIDGHLLVRTCCEDIEAHAAHKSQRLEYRLENVDPVHADADAFGVAYGNLLSNAVKYSPPGAVIDIIVGPGRPGTVRFTVADRGPGIDDAQRDRLFKRFARLDAAPTGGESSTGVGLAAAYREAQWMGGELWHEPRSGGGSIFVLELPVAPMAPASASGSSAG